MKDWLRRHGTLLVLVVVFGCSLGVWHAKYNVASLTLNRLNTARASEGVAAFVPPVGYSSLSPSQQVVTMINSERAARGLPLGEVSTLDSGLITQSLDANVDPVPIANVPGVVETDTIWGWSSLGSANSASEMGTTIEYIDYSWVYNDGWNGTLALTTNTDCTSKTAPGCNGHRDAVLRANPKGTTLVIIAGASSNVDVVGKSGGTSAAAELVWTTDPSQFSPTTTVS
jgi:hypothetical protein